MLDQGRDGRADVRREVSCYCEQVVASGTTMVRPGLGVVVAKPEASGPNVGPARLLTRVPAPQVVVAVSAEAGTANATDKPKTSEAMIIRRLYICTLLPFGPTTRRYGLKLQPAANAVNPRICGAYLRRSTHSDAGGVEWS